MEETKDGDSIKLSELEENFVEINKIKPKKQYWTLIIILGSVLVLAAVILLVFLLDRGISSPYSITASYNTTNLISFNFTYLQKDDYYQQTTNLLFKNFNLSIYTIDSDTLRIKLTPYDINQWEIPENYPYPFIQVPNSDSMPIVVNFGIYVYDNPFFVRIVRISTGEVIFDTSCNDFIYSQLYIQIGVCVPSSKIAGLGERVTNFFLGDGVFSIWPEDQPGVISNGKAGSQTYGWQPLYYFKEMLANNFDLVFLRNSNAMDIYWETENMQMTYKIAGGIFDFFIFLGSDDPEMSLKKYHDLMIGGWSPIPFWAFGFHQSRWGYQNLQALETVYNSYYNASLPLDAIWSDIDYMQNYCDFTLSSNYYGYNTWKDSTPIRTVVIIDSGVGVNCPNTNIGSNFDVYMKDYLNPGEYFTGYVWPGDTYWVDYLHPNSSDFWNTMFTILRNNVSFDGIWLDMNEHSNFCNGHCSSVDDTIYDNLPYTPTGAPLRSKTISMNVTLYDGSIQFNTHSINNGFLEVIATYQYLLTIPDFVIPFILTRSNQPGTGRYAAHWTGDNNSTYEYMQLSIPGIITSGIFGIPFTGADICGFNGNTTVDLCSRWAQLGAWYPFSRNHDHIDSSSQEFYALGPTVEETARVSYQLRYSLLKYYCTKYVVKNRTGIVFSTNFLCRCE